MCSADSLSSPTIYATGSAVRREKHRVLVGSPNGGRTGIIAERMNWEAISAIGQIVGAIGVIISVIYLAQQIRSNARQTRLASMRSMSDAFNQWLQSLAENSEFGDLYYRGMQDFASIQGADLPRFSALMDHLFRIYEDMYYQKLEGHLDPRVWRGFEAPMRDIIAYPGAQAWWRSRSHWFSREFAEFIDGLARAASPPALYRERVEAQQAAE